MPIIKKNVKKSTWVKLILIVLGILLLCGYIFWDLATSGPIFSRFGNSEWVQGKLESLGPAAPILFVLLTIIQTIVAPIPGQVVGGIGGLLFGWWGILWSMIGGTIGYLVVILLARKFGRPLLEKIFKKEAIDKFDFALGDNAAIILFLIFLLPGLPDDMVGYMAGLTNVPLGKLMTLVTLGRLPSVIVMNYVGMGLSESNLVPVIIVCGIVVTLLAIIAWKREKLIAFLKKHSKSKSDTINAEELEANQMEAEPKQSKEKPKEIEKKTEKNKKPSSKKSTAKKK